MKRLILSLLTGLLVFSVSFSQNTVEKIEYWDSWQTQKKRVWHELGDGTWHGDVKFYKQNGIIEYQAIMNYGVLKSKTLYFQDGTVMIKINNNAEGKKEGIQELYNMTNGRRFLKARAVITNGVVKDYKCYYKENALKFSYSNNGNTSDFKRYDEGGKITLNISTTGGKVSDFETFGITIKNNKFEKVAINTITSEIRDNKYYVNQKGQYAYYDIPEQHNFNLDAVFNYSDNFTIEFDLDLTLREENSNFSLNLNSSYYDDYNKYDYSASSFIYYISKLTINGIVKSIDRNGNNLEINYENGKDIWEKNFYADGTLKRYKEGQNTKEYNEKGVLIKQIQGDNIKEYNEKGLLSKETQGNKFKIYDEGGKIIDSNEIREKYNELNNQLNSLNKEYGPLNDEINLRLKDFFCINDTTGEFLKVCYTKDNQYIYKAFQTLHYEYLRTWKDDYYQKYKNTLKDLGYSIATVDWKNEVQLIEKINLFNAEISLLSQNIPLNKSFYSIMQKFGEILASPDVKKTNKSLKDINDIKEINRIVSL